MKRTIVRSAGIAVLALIASTPLVAQRGVTRIEVVVPASLRPDALTGRLFVIVTRDSTPEPRLQAGSFDSSVPFFGIDVVQLAPGTPAVIDASTLGFPVDHLDQLPAGDYLIQAPLNVYSRFPRADGHVLWLHDDQWEGQHFNASPGNLVSAVQRVHLDPVAGYTVRLSLARALPPIPPPADTKWVKHIKFQSRLLTAFWGRPISLGATVLLPKGYDQEPGRSYPAIPFLETHFRVLREPWARLLTGGSTGGWEALALQVYHPDFFGGAWALYPDPVDFCAYQLSNVYRDTSAFVVARTEWIASEIPTERERTGMPVVSVRQESWLEAVLGSYGRSGEQFDAWEAVWGPIGDDGYPKDLWDHFTGTIHHDVAAWMRAHDFDLRDYLERNWPKIGPQLVGKIHLYVGDMDSYYLNLAVYYLEDFLEHRTTPHYAGAVTYGRPLKPHGWQPMSNAELVREMAGYVERHRPAH